MCNCREMNFEEYKAAYLKNNLTLNNIKKCMDGVYDHLSDGYHSFNELYFHRIILFSIICNQNIEKSWKSKLHQDGTMYLDYFIVGIDTKEGQFTYHYHLKYDKYFSKIKELEKAPEWDGHKSHHILRLLSLLEEEKENRYDDLSQQKELKSTEEKLKEIHEKNEDDKLFCYKEIILKSRMKDFYKGYIVRFMDEQEKIFDTQEESFLNEIKKFLYEINIEWK